MQTTETLTPAARLRTARALGVWQRPRLDQARGLGPGVAAGLARELGIDVVLVRVAFVVLAVAGGWGIGLYLIAWVLMRGPADKPYRPIPKAESARWRLVGFAMVMAGLVLAATELSDTVSGALVWPVTLIGLAVAVMWDQGGDPRQQISELSRAEGLATRVLFGIGSLVAGIIVALALNLSFWRAFSGIAVALLVVVGAIVLFAPVIARLGSDLIDERRRRIRSEERADMAAHLHDSVLQTLTLIQKRSQDSDVVGLARRQERELRSWLFEDQSLTPSLGFRAALGQELGDVEAAHGVAIELVVVGDVTVDEGVRALVRAAREAATNAAKHSGAARIDVFAEVGPAEVTAFVRDQGAGFDPDEVDDDRVGISDSILARMARHGGQAQVHSAPGDGTEIELTIARTTASPNDARARHADHFVPHRGTNDAGVRHGDHGDHFG